MVTAKKMGDDNQGNTPFKSNPPIFLLPTSEVFW